MRQINRLVCPGFARIRTDSQAAVSALPASYTAAHFVASFAFRPIYDFTEFTHRLLPSF